MLERKKTTLEKQNSRKPHQPSGEAINASSSVAGVGLGTILVAVSHLLHKPFDDALILATPTLTLWASSFLSSKLSKRQRDKYLEEVGNLVEPARVEVIQSQEDELLSNEDKLQILTSFQSMKKRQALYLIEAALPPEVKLPEDEK